ARPRSRFRGLFEPVDGNRYDLIVSNPPFVISPEGLEALPAASAPLLETGAEAHAARPVRLFAS
ncbi:hypothetical protein ACWEP3_27105, partial [Streptomyces albidoflavus]